MTEIQIKGAIMLVTGLSFNKYAATLNCGQITAYRVIKGEQTKGEQTKAVQEAISKTVSQVSPVSLTWPIKKAAA